VKGCPASYFETTNTTCRPFSNFELWSLSVSNVEPTFGSGLTVRLDTCQAHDASVARFNRARALEDGDGRIFDGGLATPPTPTQ
jgi:hypothetical protein